MILAGLGFIPFLLRDPAGWVTGPTPDTISMVLIVVATAYLLDAFWSRNLVWGTVACVVGVVAATVRTQLWAYAAILILVLLAHTWRSSGRSRAWKQGGVLASVGAALIVLMGLGMLIRDYILSGWLLFPATVFPMPVDWRVPDPAASREWIMSWAREPGASPEEVRNSWDWLWPWVGRTASDWSVVIMLGALSASILLWLLARNTRPLVRTQDHGRVGWRGFGLLISPTVVSLALWFIAAPDPRFAWGLLLALGLIPLALCLSGLSIRVESVRSPGVVLAVTASFMSLAVAGPVFSGLVNIKGYVEEGFELREYSFGPISITAHINPVDSPAMVEFMLDDGNMILTPTQDDRCHLAFPSCRPYPDATMQFRGDSVADGFRYPSIDLISH